MKYVIRKGSLKKDLFLTASRRWGRYEKAQRFVLAEAEAVGENLSHNNWGIFPVGRSAKCCPDG